MMFQFFHAYIGYSGLTVLIGALIITINAMSFGDGGPETAAGPTIGVVMGSAVALVGAAIWIIERL